MAEEKIADLGPVLYKCPYCVRGRFWDWDVAVKHIKENHNRGNSNRRRPRRDSDNTFDENNDLLETQQAGYNRVQESHVVA